MKISVAMCTYNGARYLREQLESIAAQGRLPDELVVCDDRSSDSTREIVAEFAASSPFAVRAYRNERNLGSTKNFERAISLCEGEIIALSDQDDVWSPLKLRRIEERFAREPGAGLVFTDAEVVDEELRPLGYRLWESVGFDLAHRRLVRGGRALDVLLPGWTVTGATMAFRSRFKNLVLDIPEDLALIHDGWIALLIASVADVSFIEEPLVKYRQHARQQIGARARKADEDGGAATGLDAIREAIGRPISYGEMIGIGSRARLRLAERRDAYGCDVALARLDARLKHLRARASLPEGKLKRARCVLGELLSRRYHLYSNGVYSAVKDLLA
ncbi:MAG: glycosyltransferase family 2 protein [Acidobacteria bacterium]|nr:glycosyltransferase family 2 protein [Acidobacteriota bacterium]